MFELSWAYILARSDRLLPAVSNMSTDGSGGKRRVREWRCFSRCWTSSLLKATQGEPGTLRGRFMQRDGESSKGQWGGTCGDQEGCDGTQADRGHWLCSGPLCEGQLSEQSRGVVYVLADVGGHKGQSGRRGWKGSKSDSTSRSG